MGNKIKYAAYFPDLSTHNWVQDFRKQYDPKALLVAPHLTLIFPTSNISAPDFKEEVRKISESFTSFFVNFKSVMIIPEKTEEKLRASIFLVPDDGFSNVIRLHSALYSNLLKPELRLDIPFIPHITIASNLDINHAKILCDNLNQNNFCISAKVDHIQIVEIENSLKERQFAGRFLLMANNETDS